MQDEARAKLSAANMHRYRGKPARGRYMAGDGHWMLTGEIAKSHPLVNSAGQVAEHRMVLYNKVGPGPHPCHVCGKSLEWGGKKGICVDHLDDDKLNNAEDNLAPACLVCNWHRGDPWNKRWHPEEVGTIQTFWAFKTAAKTAAALDMARLGKQRAETLQILRALRHETEPVGNIHAYNMWRGYEPALVLYGLIIAHEWRVVRKFNDNTWGKLAEYAEDYGMLGHPDQEAEWPAWTTDKWVMRSHRSRLIEKMPHHYGKQFGATPENMPYLWPAPDENGYRLFLSKADVERLKTGERNLYHIRHIDLNTGEVQMGNQ